MVLSKWPSLRVAARVGVGTQVSRHPMLFTPCYLPEGGSLGAKLQRHLDSPANQVDCLLLLCQVVLQPPDSRGEGSSLPHGGAPSCDFPLRRLRCTSLHPLPAGLILPSPHLRLHPRTPAEIVQAGQSESGRRLSEGVLVSPTPAPSLLQHRCSWLCFT